MARGVRLVGCLLIGLAALVGLGSYVSLGSLTRFIADDYCVAYYARHFGLLRSIWYWYINWSGTYSTSVADWLLVWIRAERIAVVVPVVVLLWLSATIVAIALLLPSSVSQRLRGYAAACLGTLTVFIVLLISPDVPESLFWWTGMRAYVLPLIILTSWVAAMRWFEQQTQPRWVLLGSAASFAIMVLIGGFSETLTPVLLILLLWILGVGMLAHWVRVRDPLFFFLLAGLLGVLASLLIILVAPGNAQRLAYSPPPPGFFRLLLISLNSYGAFLSNIVRTPEKALGLLGALLGAAWLGRQMRSSFTSNAAVTWLALLSAFAFAFGCFIPAAWGLSDAPPDRNLTIPAFFLATGLLTFAFALGSQGSQTLPEDVLDKRTLPVLIIALALLALAAFGTVRTAISSRHEYVDYAAKWDRVNAQIISARQAGESVVQIPDMHGWAALDVPNDNPKYWLTSCVSKYYGIQVFGP